VRYLITGGAGFIGSHVADHLVARGDRVIILDDFSTGRDENVRHLGGADVELVQGSTTDRELVDFCFESVDACFHLASAVGVKLIVEEPLESLLANIRGIDVVLSAAARHRRPLLFTSTSELYGKNGNTRRMSEDADRLLGSPLQSRWAYAEAKALGESLAYAYVRQRDAAMTVARLFNTVGPRQTGRFGMVLPRLVRQALTGLELTVYGDGSQTRCFVHVHDTVRALVLLVDSDQSRGRVFNVGSESEISVLELATRVVARTGTDSPIVFVPYEVAYESGFEELGRRIPDTTALRELTGWVPTRSVDEAIDDVIAHERELLATLSETSTIAA
jgi:UDP-glucose 4-epimerase